MALLQIPYIMSDHCLLHRVSAGKQVCDTRYELEEDVWILEVARRAQRSGVKKLSNL
jgi:hypothetical protein